MDSSTKQYILVGVLDWGLGHASRCVPLIRFLEANGHSVKIGGSGASLELLRKEFPELEAIELPAYDVDYPRSGSLHWHLTKSIPRFLKVIRNEHRFLKNLVDKGNIKGVVSDNRPGLWSARIPSIYLTHQYTVLSGVTSGLSSFFHRRLFRNFDRVWIPDRPGQGNLAGKLSQSGRKDHRVDYIGPLSRIQKKELKKDIDVLALLGGPESARTTMENIVLRSLSGRKGSHVVVRGSFSDTHEKQNSSQLEIIDFALGDDLCDLINRSKLVIARSGYSSLMDLEAAEAKAVLIPTSGQPEQEYLGEYWSETGRAVVISESKALKEELDLSYTNALPFNAANSNLLTVELLKIFGAPD